MRDTIRRGTTRGTGNLIWLTVGFAAAISAQPAPDSGQTLFAANCAVCHGGLGDGGSAPDLTNRQWQAGKTDEQLEQIIRDGVRASAMPAFGDRLNAESRRMLVRHIRALAAGAVDSPAAAKTPEIAVGAEQAAGRGAGREQLADVRARLLEPRF